MTLPEVLFTGFEPFGEFSENPSWAVARHAAEAFGPGARAERLPVTFRTASAFGPGVAVAAEAPRMVVHVGLAGNRDAIGVERFARNRSDGKADNDGETGPEMLVPDGPERLATPFDTDRFARRLAEESGRRAETSDSAGAYVCNAIYYHSLLAAGETRVLFVHVPPLDEEGQRAVGQALGRVLREER
jgi:pyroglutamyl-peptidase